MIKKNVECYYNEDKTAVAILISPGFGAGWSTWCWEYPEIAYDKRVIEWYFNNTTASEEDASMFLESIGYPNVYCGGFHQLVVEWIPRGVQWRIKEYDGSESLETVEMVDWNTF